MKVYQDYPVSLINKDVKCLSCKRIYCDLRIIDNQDLCLDCYQKNPKINLLEQSNINKQPEQKKISVVIIFILVFLGTLILSTAIIALIVGLGII